MSQGSEASRPALLTTLAVAVIALVGLALRLVGIRFGDPFARTGPTIRILRLDPDGR